MQKLTLFLNGIIVLSAACGEGADRLTLSRSPHPAPQGQNPCLARSEQEADPPDDDAVLKPLQESGGNEAESEAESESESDSRSKPKAGRHSCDETPNHVRGGSFETQPFVDCGWQTYDVMDRGVIAAQECDLPDHPGCAVLLLTEVWGDDWVAEFYQNLDLEPGHTYRFSFEAKADREPRDLVLALLGAGPEGGLGNETVVALWPDRWTIFRETFTATEEAAIYTKLVFAIGGSDTGLYLDNVEIVPVSSESDGGE